MLRSPKILKVGQSSPRLPPAPAFPHRTPTNYHPLPDPKPHCCFSRRELAIRSNSLILSLSSSQALLHLSSHQSKAKTQENVGKGIEDGEEQDIEKRKTSISTGCSDREAPTARAFLDIAIDGLPVGRIIVGLYGDSSPVGAARFGELVSAGPGIGYKRKEFNKIMPNYVQHGGARPSGVDAAEPGRKGGRNFREAERLIEEWERSNGRCPGVKSMAGAVSLIVRDPSRPPPRPKLVARNGRLEMDEEEVKAAPSGTQFAVAIKDSPELDDSALVVGRVLEGMDVVERIGQLKTVQDNTASPYFR